MSVPDILYHYCSVDSFYKIVQSNEIWLSDSYVLNDYKENTWITPMIKEIFDTKKNQKYGELFNKILKTYDLSNYIPYVSCYSTDGDVLSQWRAYADDGAGVAIGLNARALTTKNKIPMIGTSLNVTLGISEMIYDEERQRQIVNATLERNLKTFESGEWDFNKTVLETTAVLKKYSVVFKNPKFREEQEWRIIHTPLIMGDSSNATPLMGNISDIFFRVASSILISYFKMDLSKYIKGPPFSEIVFGPKCKILKHSIDMYLRARGHINTKISSSEVSYR